MIYFLQGYVSGNIISYKVMCQGILFLTRLCVREYYFLQGYVSGNIISYKVMCQGILFLSKNISGIMAL